MQPATIGFDAGILNQFSANTVYIVAMKSGGSSRQLVFIQWPVGSILQLDRAKEAVKRRIVICDSRHVLPRVAVYDVPMFATVTPNILLILVFDTPMEASLRISETRTSVNFARCCPPCEVFRDAP